jgi:hypothetical protein
MATTESLQKLADGTEQPQATLQPLDLDKVTWKCEPSFATEAQTFVSDAQV